MSADPAGEASAPTPDWYRRAFGDTYLEVYPHRDPEEAAGIVSWLAPSAGVAGARVLDLACGAARFEAPLRAAGARAYVGVDLSAPLLGEAARAVAGRSASWVLRADMRRVPLRGRSIDVVLSMFTSFGYFDDEGNRGVLAETARVLRPGGCLVVDVLNRRWLLDTIVPESVREQGRVTVRETRRVEGDHVRKLVEVSEQGRRVDRYVESVRLLDVDELSAWARVVGLHRRDTWGDYAGGEFEPSGSPRLIVRLSKEAS